MFAQLFFFPILLMLNFFIKGKKVVHVESLRFLVLNNLGNHEPENFVIFNTIIVCFCFVLFCKF